MSAALHNMPPDNDAERLKAAAVLFNEIASLAAELVRILKEAIDNGEDAVAARSLAAQVGLIADAGGAGCGTFQVYGGAAEWLLSPSGAEAFGLLQASASTTRGTGVALVSPATVGP